LTFRFSDASPHFPFLIVLGVIAWIAAQQNPRAFRMDEIPMAAFSASIVKPFLFQFGNQLANLSRHSVSK
jgi:hypothetical protein